MPVSEETTQAAAWALEEGRGGWRAPPSQDGGDRDRPGPGFQRAPQDQGARVLEEVPGFLQSSWAVAETPLTAWLGGRCAHRRMSTWVCAHTHACAQARVHTHTQGGGQTPRSTAPQHLFPSSPWRRTSSGCTAWRHVLGGKCGGEAQGH